MSAYEYIQKASKIMCIGRNYAAHIKELNNTTPKQPFFFLKPTSSVITPLSNTPKPAAKTINQDILKTGSLVSSIPTVLHKEESHHEIEIALIMKHRLSNIPLEECENLDLFKCIKGVSISLDLTARNLQDEAKKKGLPWSIGKGFDTFCPLGPLVPIEKLDHSLDFQKNFKFKLFVNGDLRQDGDSTLMLTSFSKILQHISNVMVLEQDDIVLTGTPSGVGELHPGDVLRLEMNFGGKKLSDVEFVCEERPGPYTFKET
ncbi:Fmp41 protein [Hanseniaspora uvarum]|nr:Fmp41 protein [Hanseniaspora uvarum]